MAIEFELQREKDKNRILQERLKNKQIFISQIKEMHAELQALSQQCRYQLQKQRANRHDLQTRVLREYTERIAELQHQISVIKSRNKNQEEPLLKYKSKDSGNNKIKINLNTRKQMNEITEQNFFSSPLNNEKIKDISQKGAAVYEEDGVAKFIDFFLEMSQFYLPEIQSLPRIKQLKTSWKWIKQVVKYWGEMQSKYKQHQQFLAKINKQLGLNENATQEEFLNELQKLPKNLDSQSFQ